jgi:hypothetical protein
VVARDVARASKSPTNGVAEDAGSAVDRRRAVFAVTGADGALHVKSSSCDRALVWGHAGVGFPQGAGSKADAVRLASSVN